MNKKKSLTLFFLILIIILGFVFIGYTDNRIVFTIKNSIPLELRNLVKKSVLFPFFHRSEINALKKTNKKLTSRTSDLEDQVVYLREYLNDIDLNKSQGTSFSLPLLGERKTIKSEKGNKYNLKKYYFVVSTPWQYTGRKPGGYLTKFNNKVFILNGVGVIGFFEKEDLNNDMLDFQIIKTNFKNIISDDSNMYKPGRASFRGMIIENENVYISYYKKIKEGCYNIGILKAKFNLSFLKFSEFFSFDECSTQMSNHSGAKMVPYDNDSFFFTIGDGQLFIKAQKNKSFFGKIIKINYNDASFELIAKGMRDTQGAYWDKKSNILLLTEHGPKGGDEINILRKDELDKNINFGWPIATYGALGPTPIKENKFTIKNLNNHTPNGFKEPAYWFKGNSVAPSAIINVDGFKESFNRDFFMSAMGNVPAPGRRSLHHFKLDENTEKLIPSDIIPVGERIRDLIYLEKDKRIILLLENSPSIAVIENNK